MNSTTAQDRRTVRAQSQRANYECRTSYIGGSLSVFVVNTVNEVVYTVRAGRCNCEDFRHRCDGKGLKCKHILLAEEHLGFGEVEEESVTEEAADVRAETISRPLNVTDGAAYFNQPRIIWVRAGGEFVKNMRRVEVTVAVAGRLHHTGRKTWEVELTSDPAEAQVFPTLTKATSASRALFIIGYAPHIVALSEATQRAQVLADRALWD